MLPLSYNSNLHPGETIDELIAALSRFTGPLRQRLGWQRIGIDLRLGSGQIHECQADPRALTRLRRALDEAGAHAYTVNAFPLSPFQHGVVKDQVYAPDWTTQERIHDSMAAIGIACALCDDELITISTSPGSYKPWGPAANDPHAIAAGFGAWAAVAYRHAQASGRRVVLCPEPEPWCSLETSSEVAALWTGALAEHGVAAAAAALDGDHSAARQAIADHLALCHDTCHTSCAFEDQASAINTCAAAGAVPLKVQISACPETDASNSAGISALRALNEPRFLHQSAIERADASVVRLRDLDELDAGLAATTDAKRVRSHFHIPLDPPPSGPLRSTIADSVAGLHAAVAAGAQHIAVETYTWSILAADEADALAGTARELAWLQEQITDK
ncbi:MAG: metabolite traffic protein EboE [Planctomycetota bacterium]|jgi:hypothetical protein